MGVELLDFEGINMLYKYRHFESSFHLETISQNKFYSASFDELNDIYELPNRVSYKNLNENNITNYLNNMISDRKEKIPINEKWQVIREHKRELANDSEAYYTNKATSFTNTLRKSGICSFSANNWDSILSWAHYANNNDGFCVGLNFKRLLPIKQYLPCLIMKVKYEEYYSVYDILESSTKDILISVLSNKSKVWEYENEVRIITQNIKSKPFFVPKDSICEVILGIRCKDENILLMKNLLLKLNNRRIKLYQIVQKPNQYSFDRIELEY